MGMNMKMLKQGMAALAAVSVLAVAASAEEMMTAVGEGEGFVDIVAWPGYIERGQTDPKFDWVSDFEAKTSCQVRVKTANTSDEMVALMNEGGFDLVTASGDASLRLISGKRVQPINTELVPSWSSIDERLQNAPWHTVDGVHYGVPYQWGANVLAYNTNVFKEPPKSWAIVFEEQELPDGQSSKGRVQAFDGPIYIADAALYLMKHKPDLGITDPYELNQAQYDAALELLRGQRQIVSRYWHDAFIQIDDFKNEGVVASSSWPFQVNLLARRQPAHRVRGAGGRGDRLGRLDHDARRRPASQLCLHVARAFAQPEASGRPCGLVRLGAGEPRGLHGQRAVGRRGLRDQRARQFRADPLLAHAGVELQPGRVRSLLSLGLRLHRGPRRTVMHGTSGDRRRRRAPIPLPGRVP
jgi:putative spermidine/putrescine transport system substrate-binding protein